MVNSAREAVRPIYGALRSPQHLKPGGTVGVVSPAGCPDPHLLAAGIACLKRRGYHVVTAPHILDRDPKLAYLAGCDRDRAADMNAFLRRPDINAIFCARGGFGSAWLMQDLDWQAAADNAPLFVGFSDATTLHLGFERFAGLRAIYGPNVTTLAALEGEAADWFWQLLTGEVSDGAVPGGPDVLCLSPGVATAPLTGGCLTLLAAACGAPYQPDFTGKIVALEDVGEPVYRIDRCLAQLYDSGILQTAAGYLIGDVTGWDAMETGNPRSRMADLFERRIGGLGVPVITGFRFGHAPNATALPLGSAVCLNADQRTLTLLPPDAHFVP